jgi:methionyl-tRNA formyltransferase
MPLKTVFFGNSASEFTARHFRALLDAPCELVGVVDLPASRRETTNSLPPGLLEFVGIARECGIPVFEPLNPNKPDFVAAMRGLQPDLILAAGYALILKDAILSVPMRLAVNFHASLLPYYRGKHPVFWALRAGEPWAGLTVHAIDSGIDTGDILYQVKVRTRLDDSVATLYDRIMQRSIKLVGKLIADVECGRLPRRPQTKMSGTYYSSPSESDFRIEWSWPAGQISRYITATPGKCYQDVKKQRLFFIGAKTIQANSGAPPAKLLKLGRKRAMVAAGEGAVSLAGLRTAEGRVFPASQLLQEMGFSLADLLK